MATVAVTGATGFVGRALVRRLGSLGHQVVALSRHPTAVEGAIRTVRIESLGDRPAIESALERVDVLMHLAARVHVMRETARDPLTAFRQVNVSGTEVILQAAVAQGLEQVVLVSSIKVQGEGGERRLSADDPPGFTDPYGQSKWEAENLVRALPSSGPAWTIIRPPLVYGPGVRGNFARLLSLAAWSRRIPLPLGRIANRRSFLYVENLADLLIRLIHAPEARGRTYLVSDQEDVSTSDLISAIAGAMGGKARLLPCPAGLLQKASDWLGRRAEVDRLLGSLTLDTTPVSREIGWTPPYDLSEGIGRTVEWWREDRD